MKPLSQTRQAIVEEAEKAAKLVEKRFLDHSCRLGDKCELNFLSGDVMFIVSQALNDYTESIVRMVEDSKLISPPHRDGNYLTENEEIYNSALDDIKEELNK